MLRDALRTADIPNDSPISPEGGADARFGHCAAKTAVPSVGTQYAEIDTFGIARRGNAKVVRDAATTFLEGT